VHCEIQRITTSAAVTPNEPAQRLYTQTLISDSVTEEEHNSGKVRGVECGDVIPDPHL
jgi:hypothetical protein